MKFKLYGLLNLDILTTNVKHYTVFCNWNLTALIYVTNFYVVPI